MPIEPLRAFGTAVGEHVGLQPFTAWQSAFDPLLTPGARNYWKSHDFSELSDAAFDLIVEYAGKLPTPECEIFVAHLDGAAGRVPSDAMAYPHRNASSFSTSTRGGAMPVRMMHASAGHDGSSKRRRRMRRGEFTSTS